MVQNVIYCPNEEFHAIPKILFRWTYNIGRAHIFQNCSDRECRAKSLNRGRFEIYKNPCGGYMVKEINGKKRFPLREKAAVVVEMDIENVGEI